MIIIRTATAEDAEAIAHVHVQSWRTTYTDLVPEAYLAALDEVERAHLWRDWLTQEISTFVAELDGEIVGFVSGGSIREPLANCDAELFAIYILERAQRCGIGTCLLKALASALKANEFHSMAVWVLESNASSRFYEKSGAVPVLSKEMEIGGAKLTALAYGWPDLNAIALVL